MDSRAALDPRTHWPCRVAAIAGWSCFALLCVFYGGDINVFVFLCAIFLLMGGLTWVAPRLATELRDSPLTFAVPAVAIVGIVISYQFSLSKDSSFVPAWVVAVAPLAFILARGAGAAANALHKALTFTVLAFALVSSVALLSHGARAGLPLTDPNNYATLLCLALLPWLHRYFERRTSVQGMSLKVDATHLSAGFIMALALFATGSRAGLVIVIGAFAVWLGLAFAKRIQWWPLAAASVVSVVAYFLAGTALAEQSAALTSQAEDIGRVLGADLELREAFVRLALANYADYPVTGVGIFVFPLLYRFQRPIIDQDSAGLYVHNDYLQLLAEGGPLLFCAMLAFVAGVVALFLRGLLARPGEAAFSRLGLVMGMGAALAHAMVNFVVYSPALGFALGLTAAIAFRGAAKSKGADAVRDRPIRIVVASVLAFGWIAWLYLGLDTAIAGVLQNQRYVPFVEQVRSDPERMFRFARAAQSLNGNRGLPVLAEAALLDRRLQQNPASSFLREQALGAFRRAERADPWNPLVQFLMADFIVRNPSVLPMLRSGETPEDLLLRTLAVDPQFVPGIDALTHKLLDEGRQAEADALLRQRVYPWLQLIARQDKAAAMRYHDRLLVAARAEEDFEFVAELMARKPQLEAVQSVIKKQWFF